MIAEIVGRLSCHQLYMGPGDSNSSPHACAASAVMGDHLPDLRQLDFCHPSLIMCSFWADGAQLMMAV